MRRHLKHFNDCGCVTERKDAEIKRLKNMLAFSESALVTSQRRISNLAVISGILYEALKWKWPTSAAVRIYEDFRDGKKNVLKKTHSEETGGNKCTLK